MLPSIISPDAAAFLYLVSAVLFILSIRGLSSPETARQGNVLGMFGMAIAVVTTLALDWQSILDALTWQMILVGIVIGGGIGTLIAYRIKMTDMPQLVALLNGFGGMASVLVASAAFLSPEAFGLTNETGIMKFGSRIETSLGGMIGAVTFTGSVIAFLKLQGLMTSAPLVFRGQHPLNAILALMVLTAMVLFAMSPEPQYYWAFIAISFLIGILLIVPIGGADMPVVISMLNSYSGWAAAGVGFTLENTALIVTGALVGSSGAILSYIMCKAMNRSFISVILGGFGVEDSTGSAGITDETRPVKRGSAEDAAFILKNAGSVIFVPGYGMAVAQAQHALRELADLIKGMGVDVRYAIHPVAGRMPGHMNVLLAEADVPYDDVFELDDINRDFATTDVAFVIGANDVTNPAAKTDTTSPIYGMPVLDVEKAKTVLFVKRSLGSGFAGVENELFFRENTMMLFSDAKKMVEDIVKAI